MYGGCLLLWKAPDTLTGNPSEQDGSGFAHCRTGKGLREMFGTVFALCIAGAVATAQGVLIGAMLQRLHAVGGL